MRFRASGRSSVTCANNPLCNNTFMRLSLDLGRPATTYQNLEKHQTRYTWYTCQNWNDSGFVPFAS
jgi:hypothetical protein